MLSSISDETTLKMLQNQHDALEELFSPQEFQRPGFPSTITIAYLYRDLKLVLKLVLATVWGGNVGAFCNGIMGHKPVLLSRSQSCSRGTGTSTRCSGSRAINNNDYLDVKVEID